MYNKYGHTHINKNKVHMATTQLHSLLLILPLLLVTYKATSSHHHDHHHNRALHFSLYQHETINKTGFIIVSGVIGPGVSQTTTPFGTIFTFQDPMTVTAKTSSMVRGIVEGTSITSGLDGLRSISIAKITLNLKDHKGSISILGVVHNTKPSKLPVVGGTDDFLFVNGYVKSSPVNLVGLTVTYKIEFHLYWPPFPVHEGS
ncbi:uncharacterized protein LOC143855095 [Tasmannia lanceolata]|uniref:uncharacterized protein LOC143855095 n=1 Tax=Tasmannia lanceolata TaxID=3420 RepID=UPI0040642CD0